MKKYIQPHTEQTDYDAHVLFGSSEPVKTMHVTISGEKLYGKSL